MPDRTLGQVTKEIDQLAGEITSLEAQVLAKRDKLTSLVREQVEIQASTLSRFGMKLVLENSRNGLPLDEAKPTRARAPRGSSTPQNPNRERNAMIRAWAAENNIEVPSKGKIPAEVVTKFEEANPTLL